MRLKSERGDLSWEFGDKSLYCYFICFSRSKQFVNNSHEQIKGQKHLGLKSVTILVFLVSSQVFLVVEG